MRTVCDVAGGLIAFAGHAAFVLVQLIASALVAAALLFMLWVATLPLQWLFPEVAALWK
jgi:hypothetical protein